MSALTIDRFVREHRALERLGGELRLAAVRKDAPMARFRASELAAALLNHVRSEHAEIGEFLRAQGAAAQVAVGVAHTRMADEVVAEASGFAAAWGATQRIVDDPDNFRAELEHLLVAIARWIHAEEHRLFPMLDEVRGLLPPQPPQDDEMPTLRISRADLLRAGVR